MKKLVFICVLLTSVQLFTSCASSPKRSRKPVTAITISGGNKTIFGQDVSISTKTQAKGGDIESIEIFVDNTSLKNSTIEENTISIPSKLLHLGKNYIRVVAKKEDGTIGENRKTITVFANQAPKNISYKVVNTFKHDTQHFTQGFEIVDGFIYEGTGEYGHSGIYKKEIESGKIYQERKMSDAYFGEGITIFNEKIYQITYKKQQGFIYDLKTFDPIGEFNFPNKEGWGLTHNDSHIIMSDGSENLFFLNPKTLKEEYRLQVYTNKNKVLYLNELEYVNGVIYANIWTTNSIVKIDAKTGQVLGQIQLNELKQNAQMLNPGSDVLNGIAYDFDTEKMYVTGKMWPHIFEIELSE